MKYELINKNIESKSLLNVVMDNRNITKEQVERLLKARENEYRNPFEIENMDRAVECFKKIYKLKHPIDNIKVFHHLQEKAHGLNTDIVEEMLK